MLYAVATTISFVAVWIFQCKPVAAAFDLLLRMETTPPGKLTRGTSGGNCIDMLTAIYRGAVLNIIEDLMVLALPLRAVWQLRNTVGRVKQAAVMVMVSMGGVYVYPERSAQSIIPEF